MQCCLKPLGQHCTSSLPVQCCPKSIETILNSFFPCAIYLDPLGQPCARTLLVQCCPKTLETTLNSIFSCAMLSGASCTTLHKDFTFAKRCLKTIKTTLNSIFSCAVLSQASCTTLHKDFTCVMFSQEYWDNIEQFFFLCSVVSILLDNIAQGFLSVQCCTKGIKITLNSIFSCAVLSQASCTTLHKDFTCAMFSKEYWDSIEQFFFLCSVVSSLLDNIAHGFFLCNVKPRVSGQHWIILFSCAMLSGASWTTLHKDFTCAVLYQRY